MGLGRHALYRQESEYCHSVPHASVPLLITRYLLQSSAELSEAINSMWNLYRQSAICIVYINDCQERGFSTPPTEYKWFKRGKFVPSLWTSMGANKLVRLDVARAHCAIVSVVFQQELEVHRHPRVAGKRNITAHENPGGNPCHCNGLQVGDDRYLRG